MPRIHLQWTERGQFAQILQAAQLLTDDESILAISRPGDGNMNFAARIKTSRGNSYIVKQARAYVEKYPAIPAPVERALVEANFYRTVQDDDVLRVLTPKLLYLDEVNSILVIEDLGEASDFTFLYRKDGRMAMRDLHDLMRFLNSLHSFPTSVANTPRNLAMRALNAEHIFRFPFQTNNGLDLDDVTPGIQAIAQSFRLDERIRNEAQVLQSIYLAPGDTLLHGDYYPGSWLHTGDGARVIDPEFGFVGPKEFDVGVMMAHLHMALQPQGLIDTAFDLYQPAGGFDSTLFQKFVGIEIFRRLIGLAQLPLELGLDEKQQLLSQAQEWLLG